MFYCKKCGFEFNKPRKIYEGHGMKTPPFEEFYVCPSCNSKSFTEKRVTHCRCCGARLVNSTTGYCSNRCKERGEKLYSLEKKRRKIREESPVNEIIKKVNEYNLLHKTNYSYGQYVALILPKEKAEKECKTKRKNT